MIPLDHAEVANRIKALQALADALRFLQDASAPKCPECGGDLGGHHFGRLERHKSGCPRFPL